MGRRLSDRADTDRGMRKTPFGGNQYADHVSAADDDNDDPTRKTCSHGNSATLSHTYTLFLDILYRLLPDPRLFQSGRNMLRSLGRLHTVWLCTEGSPKNGQGSHAVLTTDLMRRSWRGAPMDHKYSYDQQVYLAAYPSLLFSVIAWSRVDKPLVD